MQVYPNGAAAPFSFDIKNVSGKDLTNVVLILESDFDSILGKKRAKQLIFIEKLKKGQAVYPDIRLVGQVQGPERTPRRGALRYTLLCDQLSKTDVDLDLFVAKPTRLSRDSADYELAFTIAKK